MNDTIPILPAERQCRPGANTLDAKSSRSPSLAPSLCLLACALFLPSCSTILPTTAPTHEATSPPAAATDNAAATPAPAAFAASPTQQPAVDLPTERRYALVVGNANYGSEPLLNPVNDARAISTALQSMGFEVTRLENASIKQMSEAARMFGDKLQRGDVGLFFYAGHGMQIKGRNYLIPIGADIQREDEVAFNAFDAGLMLDKMDSAHSRVNIVILDACRDNPFASSFRSSNQGLARMDAPVGTYLAFSTAPAKVASDGRNGNGLYTQHLLNAMGMPGLKIEDVFKRVRINVMKDSGGQQIPWDSSSLTGDFYFVPPSSDTTPLSVATGRSDDGSHPSAPASASALAVPEDSPNAPLQIAAADSLISPPQPMEESRSADPDKAAPNATDGLDAHAEAPRTVRPEDSLTAGTDSPSPTPTGAPTTLATNSAAATVAVAAVGAPLSPAEQSLAQELVGSQLDVSAALGALGSDPTDYAQSTAQKTAPDPSTPTQNTSADTASTAPPANSHNPNTISTTSGIQTHSSESVNTPGVSAETARIASAEPLPPQTANSSLAVSADSSSIIGGGNSVPAPVTGATPDPTVAAAAILKLLDAKPGSGGSNQAQASSAAPPNSAPTNPSAQKTPAAPAREGQLFLAQSSSTETASPPPTPKSKTRVSHRAVAPTRSVAAKKSESQEKEAATVALYQTGLEAKGRGDLGAAAKAFREAAAGDHIEAKYELGLLLKVGRRPIVQDLAESHRLFQQAAEGGSISGQYELAQMFAQGIGVTRNCGRAIEWARKSAEAGSPDAALLLGELDLATCNGTKNPEEAARWFRVGAEQGLAKAQFFLGVLYMSGEGVPKDLKEARKWLTTAANQNHTTARFYLGRLGE